MPSGHHIRKNDCLKSTSSGGLCYLGEYWEFTESIKREYVEFSEGIFDAC